MVQENQDERIQHFRVLAQPSVKKSREIVAAAITESDRIGKANVERIVDKIAALEEPWADPDVSELIYEIISLVAKNYPNKELIDEEDKKILTFASTYAKTIESMGALTFFAAFGYVLDDAMGRKSLSLNSMFDEKTHPGARVSLAIIERRILFLKQINYIISVFSFASKARMLMPEISSLCAQFLKEEKRNNG